MPLYELFCVARPALSRSECITLIQNAATAVLQRGGILTDIKSFGERELAYEIRRPGLRMKEVIVSALLSMSPRTPPLAILPSLSGFGRI